MTQISGEGLFGVFEVGHPDFVEATIDACVEPFGKGFEPFPAFRQHDVELVSNVDALRLTAFGC